MAVKDSDPEKWGYPEHTAAKHAIFANYLDAWFPILASGYGRVLVMDGFAGRGVYTDGSPGSPIIALSRLLGHSFWPRMAHREFVFLFIEHDPKNAASLRQAIEEFKAKWQADNGRPWPANVKYAVREGTFEEHAQEICEYLEEQKKRLAPTFAFIDPFGWTGMPMELIAQLLDHRSCEVFITFMVGNVNRFLTQAKQGDNMNELFGLDVGRVLEEFGGGNRVEHLRDVYMSQLKEMAGFPYVRWFAMTNSTGNVGYYLLHGTREVLGVEKMKDAMWKIAPSGDYSFSDLLAGKQVLFTAEPDLRPLRDAILATFAGRGPVMVKPDLEQWVILNTPYRKPHLRPVLRELETAGRIEVARGVHKQFAPGVTIEVPPQA